MNELELVYWSHAEIKGLKLAYRSYAKIKGLKLVYCSYIKIKGQNCKESRKLVVKSTVVSRRSATLRDR